MSTNKHTRLTLGSHTLTGALAWSGAAGLCLCACARDVRACALAPPNLHMHIHARRLRHSALSPSPSLCKHTNDDMLTPTGCVRACALPQHSSRHAHSGHSTQTALRTAATPRYPLGRLHTPQTRHLNNKLQRRLLPRERRPALYHSVLCGLCPSPSTHPDYY